MWWEVASNAAWSPRFGKSQPILIDPATAHVLDLRRVTGREYFVIDPGLTIIVLLILGARLELGVYPDYLDLVDHVIALPYRPAD